MGPFPRCAVCRVAIRAGERTVFRADGRVEHRTCPPVTCPACGKPISPGQPIRRDGETILHGNCWIKRVRELARGS
jgi:hypothetical protein